MTIRMVRKQLGIPFFGRWVALGALGMTLSLSACSTAPGSLDEPAPQKPPTMPQQPDPQLPQLPMRDPEQLPPISGGTLLITQDDRTAVAADPDRDAVWLVDLIGKSVRKRVPLQPAAEPGRIVEDADGKVHVILRGTGQVLKLDPQSGVIESTRAVCPAPRGLTYDNATDNLYVACAGGELVLMRARGGDTVQTWRLENDLRDVVMMGNGASARPVVSRFRSAELLGLDARGVVIDRIRPHTVTIVGVDPKNPAYVVPSVAWRTARLPDGRVMMLHQRGSSEPFSTGVGGYGGSGVPGICTGAGMAGAGLTGFAGFAPQSYINGIFTSTGMVHTALAVDLAISRDGTKLAVIAPYARTELDGRQITSVSLGSLGGGTSCVDGTPVRLPDIQPIAGAFDGAGQLWIQSRHPARLASTAGVIIEFSAEDRANEGHRLFHELTSSRVACASCHPEGGDDGRIWNFQDIGKRRTQSLRGGLSATAPFHWDGELLDLDKLMGAVFTTRMKGPAVTPTQVGALGKWLDAQPALPRSASADAQLVARGEALFRDASVGCATCHSGPRLTDNATRDVGTGQPFQVPSLLGVTNRAPFMHNGCAPTLRDRFNPACGGGDTHGKTSHLSAEQLDALVAYLESL